VHRAQKSEEVRVCVCVCGWGEEGAVRVGGRGRRACVRVCVCVCALIWFMHKVAHGGEGHELVSSNKAMGEWECV